MHDEAVEVGLYINDQLAFCSFSLLVLQLSWQRDMEVDTTIVVLDLMVG
jgi:hypothetical protein